MQASFSVPTLLLGTTLALGLLGPAHADRVLFDFAPPFTAPTAATQDAQTSIVDTAEGRALRVTTGHAAPWPGITLPAPGGTVDLTEHAFVQLRVRNPGPQRIVVHLRVDNPGADGTKHCRTGSLGLDPGTTGTVRVDLKRTSEDRLDGRLFGMRGYPVSAGGLDTVNPAAINQFVIFLNAPKQDHVFEVLRLSAGGRYKAPTAWTSDADPYVPLIDPLGQYRHKTWPGKTASIEDLVARRDQEAAALPGAISAFDEQAGWNRFGGWAQGPQLAATGFFRVEKHDGMWWFVDPEGRLFWSHGIDCVRLMDATPIQEREDWYVSAPWEQPEFAEFVVTSATTLKGHYAGRTPKCFSFAGANFKRKYGPDWRPRYAIVIHQRLRAWGLNTIANWSDSAVMFQRRTPYTDAVSSRGTRLIEGSEGYWGKFPDVFDPTFGASVRRSMAAKAGRSAGDPWCLGYFSDNEMAWGDETSIALAALVSPPEQSAKRAFLADLRARYENIGRLNAAWGTAHASFEALAASTARPDPARAGDDLKAFYTRAAEEYFRVVREAIKSVAPQQLYLGCRFAWGNARAARAAAKYCDVVSYNLYQRSIATFQFNGDADVPLIVGEFHFGALDRGMFHTGLVPVTDQAERAASYQAYVEGALRHPQFVGTHWFQYQDEPTTGRVLDEENYQIGFVDIADTPYAEITTTSRHVGERLYHLRSGQKVEAHF